MQWNTIQSLKEWNDAICSNIDGPRDDHTHWSKPEKDKYHMISLVCGILRNDINELIYKREIGSQTENNLIISQGDGELEVN